MAKLSIRQKKLWCTCSHDVLQCTNLQIFIFPHYSYTDLLYNTSKSMLFLLSNFSIFWKKISKLLFQWKDYMHYWTSKHNIHLPLLFMPSNKFCVFGSDFLVYCFYISIY
jgi:hypothetical protein